MHGNRKTGLLAAILAVLCLFPLRAGAEVCTVPVMRVKCEEKLIALTFDDGPHPRFTDRVLDVLAEYGAKATFFEIGINMERYPEVSQRVAEAGHELANHTDTHPHLSGISDEELCLEVTACDEKIRAITGQDTVLFRPPEGARNERRCTLLAEGGHRQILWSVDTNDWRGRSAAQIAKTVIRSAKSGDIVLFHDYISDEFRAAEALRQIVPALQGAGFRLVTVSELLAAGEAVGPNY